MDWVKQSIAENTPYDKWVFSMLTVDGKSGITQQPVTSCGSRHGTAIHRQYSACIPWCANWMRNAMIILSTSGPETVLRTCLLTSGTRDRVFAGKGGGGMSSMMAWACRLGRKREAAREGPERGP